MDILVLNKNDIKKVFAMENAIRASKDALEFYSRGKTYIPLRINIDISEKKGQSLYMPGYVPEVGALGLKIVSTYPENVAIGLDTISSMMVMKNDKTGEVSCIMDGTYLTQLRTGAIAGAATDLLSRKDSSIFALIGTGGQARTQIEAILNVRNIKEIRVFGRNKEKANNFVKDIRAEFQGKFNFNIKVAKTADEAVKDADIITTVTTSPTPVFDGRFVKKGAHINGIGSYIPEMQEIDPYILQNADKIYVETKDGVLNECGNFLIPMEAKEFSKSDITGELGEAIMGKIPLRENDNEITFFNSVGSAVLDLVTAKRIYDKAIENGIGKTIEL